MSGQKRKAWEELSVSTRKTYLGKGITPEYYEAGAPLPRSIWTNKPGLHRIPRTDTLKRSTDTWPNRA